MWLFVVCWEVLTANHFIFLSFFFGVSNLGVRFVEFGGPPCCHGSGINFFMRPFGVGSGKVTYGGGELCVCSYFTQGY